LSSPPNWIDPLGAKVRQIQINSSSYGMPGRAVAVEDGQVVWAGAIRDIDEAGSFDALFCHDDDVERLVSLMNSGNNLEAVAPRVNPVGSPR
jgi:hypothetical protein